MRERVAALDRKVNYQSKQLAQFEEQIKRKQVMIARLNDKSFKASIKTTVLGRDAQNSEYWHFKDDPGRLFTKRETRVYAKPAAEEHNGEGTATLNGEDRNANDDLAIAPESTKMESKPGDSQPGESVSASEQKALEEPSAKPIAVSYTWFYYDTEEQLEQLMESLNLKGQKERKLQENLRKVRDRLKLKKTKSKPAQLAVAQ